MTSTKPKTDSPGAMDQWIDSPEFHSLAREKFPELATMFDSDTSRRRFLQVMAASLALAGVTGCHWPEETILPYSKPPKNRTPGTPVNYATTMEMAGAGFGLLVTSYDGRPIKIEGNPSHPASRGKSNAWHQASLLELYDPDRSQHVLQREGATTQQRTWDEFRQFAAQHFARLRQQNGIGLAILSEANSSPGVGDMKVRLLNNLPNADWTEFELVSGDTEREGTRLAFGRPLRAQLKLQHAKRIVALDSDLLMTHPDSTRYAGDFAAGRRAQDNQMNRLVSFESRLSVTGGMADNRYPVRSGMVPLIARQLYVAVSRLVGSHPVQVNARSPELAEAGQLKDIIQLVADDLVAHQGESLVVAGHHQGVEVHALCAALNSLLGNVGKTIAYTESPNADRPTHTQAINTLTERMQAGEVETLIILGGNPVEMVPGDLGFANLISKVPQTIHLSSYVDETSRLCSWHVPRAHFLESWSDARAFDGTYSIVQPLIAPLYGGKTAAELLALITADEVTSPHEITRRTFAANFPGSQDDRNVESRWRQSLHDGVVADSAWLEVLPELQSFDLQSDTNAASADDGFEVCLVEDYSLFDGRFANNAWLQEWPDPISKLTWDNAALMSPADARRLGVRQQGDVVRVVHGDKSLEIAALPLPGHASGSITISLGYGRTAAGVVANEAGVRAATLLPPDGSHRLTGADVTITGQNYKLATSQDKPDMRSRVGDAEARRRVAEDLVRVATIGEYARNPEFARHDAHEFPLWKEWSYEDGRKWGLAVDLSACIGCNGCVIACQAENNIPVVGKDEVVAGRIMHWLRVDRYFQTTSESASQPDDHDQQPVDGHAESEIVTGSPELTPLVYRQELIEEEQGEQQAVASAGGSLRILHQPMTCHQCETAPCEQVCPVAATVHDKEGLSVMVYSRCIGTRYCNNNCPMKVRRFNWFWNHHGPAHPRSREDLTEVEKMLQNPNVTVRSRGVMEKCSFCSQRINAIKIKAKNEGWENIPDGVITPACAQACPTDAIVFGDLNDRESRVRKLHEDARAYELLPELNLRSRLLYLAKLTNPLEGVEPSRLEQATPQKTNDHN